MPAHLPASEGRHGLLPWPTLAKQADTGEEETTSHPHPASITFDLFYLHALPGASKNIKPWPLLQKLGTVIQLLDQAEKVMSLPSSTQWRRKAKTKKRDDKTKFSTQNTKEICSHDFYMT